MSKKTASRFKDSAEPLNAGKVQAQAGLDGEAVQRLLQGAVLKGRDPLSILRDASIDPSVYGNARAAIDGRSLVRLVRRIQTSIDDVYLGNLSRRVALI